MQTFHRALMDLAVADGEVFCQEGEVFNRAAYSHFKYGWTPPADEYGRGLAALIADKLFELADREPVVIISAPYKYLPTASHAIAQALLRELSYRAVMDGREPPVLVPFHKAKVGDSSYARSGEAERLQVVASLGLHLDESLVTGSHVLVVDDIRITGAAERATAMYLESLRPSSVWYIHAARLPEDIGRSNPGLEDELNQTVAHTFEVILEQVEQREFQLNTRVLRLLLETEDTEAFRSFLDDAPLVLVEQIHEAGLGNGAGYYNQYRSNLEIVHDTLEARAPRSYSQEGATTC